MFLVTADATVPYSRLMSAAVEDTVILSRYMSRVFDSYSLHTKPYSYYRTVLVTLSKSVSKSLISCVVRYPNCTRNISLKFRILFV